MASMSAKGVLAPGSEPEFLRALELHVPGLAIVDRELEIVRGGGVGRAAALVGRTSGGLLVLIEELAGPSEKAALRALELVALVREHASALLRRFECQSGPALVLIAGEGARELGTLLAPLLGRELQLYSFTQLKTSSGSRFALAAVTDTRMERALPTREDFIAELEASARPLAEQLWERLSSPALSARAEIGTAGARWSDARGPLCTLTRGAVGLQGRLAGLNEPIELGNEADGRGFLDAVLALHLQRALQGIESPSEPAAQAGFDPREPVLSEAEIAAFHEV
jgi:hypothetical protein